MNENNEREITNLADLKPGDRVTKIEMQDQPQPKFYVKDLEAALTRIYNKARALQVMHFKDGFEEVNEKLVGDCQELLGKIARIANDLDSIDSVEQDTNTVITTTLNTEKPAFTVCGVQLFENGKLQGTSLYSTIAKAKQIRNILNQRFAELKVDHVVKIVNYPVF